MASKGRITGEILQHWQGYRLDLVFFHFGFCLLPLPSKLCKLSIHLSVGPSNCDRHIWKGNGWLDWCEIWCAHVCWGPRKLKKFIELPIHFLCEDMLLCFSGGLHSTEWILSIFFLSSVSRTALDSICQQRKCDKCTHLPFHYWYAYLEWHWNI